MPRAARLARAGPTCVSACVCMRVRSYLCACVRACVHACMRACVHACACNVYPTATARLRASGVARVIGCTCEYGQKRLEKPGSRMVIGRGHSETTTRGGGASIHAFVAPGGGKFSTICRKTPVRFASCSFSEHPAARLTLPRTVPANNNIGAMLCL